MTKYTKTEQEQLKAISRKYSLLIDEAGADGNPAQIDALMKLADEERSVIINKAADRTFRKYKGNTRSMLDDLKKEIGSFVYIEKDMMEYDIEPVSETEAIYTPLRSPAEQRVIFDRFIEKRHERYFNYLKANDQDSYKQLLEFIDQALADPKSMESYFKGSPSTKRHAPLEKYIRPVDKTIKLFFNGELDLDDRNEIGLNRNGRAPITNYITFDYSNMEGIPPTFTPTHGEVCTAIVNLYLNGRREVSSQQIYRAMTGNNSLKITAKKAREQDQIIKQAMATLVTIERSEAAESYKDITTDTLTGPIIPAYAANRITGNDFNAQYILTGISPFYIDAIERKQITTIPANVLDVKLDYTEDVLLIRRYLIDWIQELRNPNSSQNNPDLLYSTIYDYLKIDGSPQEIKDKQKKTRDRIHAMLDHWRNVDFIHDYTILPDETKSPNRRIKYYKFKVILEAPSDQSEPSLPELDVQNGK